MKRGGKGPLPRSMDELKGLGKEKIGELWARYFGSLPKLTCQRTTRILWHKIQCDIYNIHLDQKNVTRLNRYSADPDRCIEKSFKTKYHLKSGLEIVKTFKGRQFKVLVRAPDKFTYNGKAYRTISAVAKAICGAKVSGYDFFGLANKKYRDQVLDQEVAG